MAKAQVQSVVNSTELVDFYDCIILASRMLLSFPDERKTDTILSLDESLKVYFEDEDVYTLKKAMKAAAKVLKKYDENCILSDEGFCALERYNDATLKYYCAYLGISRVLSGEDVWAEIGYEMAEKFNGVTRQKRSVNDRRLKYVKTIERELTSWAKRIGVLDVTGSILIGYKNAEIHLPVVIKFIQSGESDRVQSSLSTLNMTEITRSLKEIKLLIICGIPILAERLMRTSNTNTLN